MIKYNNRFRGPMEYDKFVINILSLNNVIETFCEMENSITANDFTTLAIIHNSVKDMYNIFTGDNGLDEKCYNIIILNGES